MSKSLIISERDNIAAVVKDEKAVEFFIHRGDILLGDVYLASVENILPSIDAAFVHVGSDKMGFLHASDITGKGALKEKLTPKQKLLVQVVKEPTGHKGPRVTTSISLPGRFLVLMPDEKGISISRKVSSAKERSRLKSIVSLLKPAGVGVIIRTEAEGQSEAEIQEDLELLLEKWNNIVTSADTVTPPNLIYRDQDLLYRAIREACTEDVEEIILDTSFGLHRTNQLLQSWNLNSNIKVSVYKGNDPLLVAKGIDKEIRMALQTKVNLPSGGYLYIQQTEALTVIDINSGKFTSSATQNETIRKTNLEAIGEIARQLRLRNIGGMIIIDFIDMESRVDKLAILEELELALEPDKAKPQIGQLSDLGLVELTRHRQGQSLAEIFTKKCPACSGTGALIEEFNFAASGNENEIRAKASKIKIPQRSHQQHQQRQNNNLNRQIQQQRHNNQNHRQEKTINTMPSLVASIFDKKKKTEVNLDFKLNEENVKEFLNNKGYITNIAKFVRFAALPPYIVNKYMPHSYNKDVFTVLQEIEDSEIIISKQQAGSSIERQNVQITKYPSNRNKNILSLSNTLIEKEQTDTIQSVNKTVEEDISLSPDKTVTALEIAEQTNQQIELLDTEEFSVKEIVEPEAETIQKSRKKTYGTNSKNTRSRTKTGSVRKTTTRKRKTETEEVND